MHTARQLRVDYFQVLVHGEQATREDVLPAWTPWDRLGVIVDRPFGALGASAMIQLCIAAFYDIRPERRAGFPTKESPRSDDAIYPEIYLFHVGGRHGFFAAYDFWPARKEVFVQADARAVLDAVNDRAITRLLVPDFPPQEVEHEYKEPAAARDRIRSAFTYAADGTAERGDVAIVCTKRAAQVNAQQVLAGANQSGNLQARVITTQNVDHDPDLVARHWATHSAQRASEAQEHAKDARRMRAALTRDGRTEERYRRISVDDALQRLVGRASAAAST